MRLRLGSKVFSVALGAQAGAGDGDEKEVRLAASVVVDKWCQGYCATQVDISILRVQLSPVHLGA